jgi:hypothetical protein
MRHKTISVCFLLVMFIFSACTNVEGRGETTIPIKTSQSNTVEVQDFTSDCSKVVIPTNVERDTNIDKEKGLLTVRWYDNSKGKDAGVVFRYNEQNCSESAREITRHVLEIEKPLAGEGTEELLQSSLTKVEGDGYSFKYIIKNKSPKEVTLTFNTSQEINFILWRKDAKGTMAYDYSRDKSFNKESHKKTIKPGEELAYDIKLSHDYEPGIYILEVYMTSNEPELGSPTKFHQNLEFKIIDVLNVPMGAEIIAESDIDYDRNGDEEKLYVRMITGELKEEKEPGPFTGAYWEGKFQLELVAKDGTLLHSLDLNSTFGEGALIFAQNRAFDIKFEDYNSDGYSDFSIGQYFSSNGSTYNLYSLIPEGIVVIHRELFTASSEYSNLYEKAGNNSFKNRYYDMERGEYVESLFTWQGEQFVRTECEGCGLSSRLE